MRYSGPLRKIAIPAGSALLLCSLWAFPFYAGDHPRAAGAAGEQFFLISSVDIKKNQVVLKAPTEVTELVRVTEKTVYLDEEGKPLQFQDLRAGDTVYANLSPGTGGLRVVTHLRKGPMTLEELHRRYLEFR